MPLKGFHCFELPVPLTSYQQGSDRTLRPQNHKAFSGDSVPRCTRQRRFGDTRACFLRTRLTQPRNKMACLTRILSKVRSGLKSLRRKIVPTRDPDKHLTHSISTIYLPASPVVNDASSIFSTESEDSVSPLPTPPAIDQYRSRYPLQIACPRRRQRLHKSYYDPFSWSQAGAHYTASTSCDSQRDSDQESRHKLNDHFEDPAGETHASEVQSSESTVNYFANPEAVQVVDTVTQPASVSNDLYSDDDRPWDDFELDEFDDTAAPVYKGNGVYELADGTLHTAAGIADETQQPPSTQTTLPASFPPHIVRASSTRALRLSLSTILETSIETEAARNAEQGIFTPAESDLFIYTTGSPNSRGTSDIAVQQALARYGYNEAIQQALSVR